MNAEENVVENEKRENRLGLPKSGRIFIPVRGKKDLEFTGKVIAEVEERKKRSKKGDGSKKERWTRLSIYGVDTNEGKKFVGVVSHLPYEGSNVEPVYFAEVCKKYSDLDKVFTKDSDLKKELYTKLGKPELMVDSLN